MNRSAPALGYIGNRKQIWRREVWNVFKREVGTKGHVLLMPSIEGEEISLAQAKGWSSHRLHVVDRNPAIVATIKRRFSNVSTYGVECSRACLRIKKAGIQLSCASLDFCGCIGESYLDELRSIVEADVFEPGACVAINMLRGREAPAISIIWQGMFLKHDITQYFANRADYDELTENDLVRLRLIFMLLPGEILRAGTYLSSNNNHTMLWAVIRPLPINENTIEHINTCRNLLDELLTRAKSSSQALWDVPSGQRKEYIKDLMEGY